MVEKKVTIKISQYDLISLRGVLNTGIIDNNGVADTEKVVAKRMYKLLGGRL